MGENFVFANNIELEVVVCTTDNVELDVMFVENVEPQDVSAENSFRKSSMSKDSEYEPLNEDTSATPMLMALSNSLTWPNLEIKSSLSLTLLQDGGGNFPYLLRSDTYNILHFHFPIKFHFTSIEPESFLHSLDGIS
ncbi:hypothetical protein VNO77_42284 [Canavalia gladiata]|uniref:Uncharacterized protein n=1 Tax=Canavalia gladiata TaxID=3824 RepID=A0AAN9K3T0_CANGL